MSGVVRQARVNWLREEGWCAVRGDSASMDDPRAIRLRQALELFDVAEGLVEQRLVREGLAAEARAARLRAWRHDRPRAPQGDCVGRLVDVRRFR